MSQSCLSLFDLGLLTRSAQLLFAHKPSTRSILFVVVVCGLWFLYSSALMHQESSFYSPPHYIHHPHYRPTYHRPPVTSNISASIWSQRADEVKGAYLHAYRGYIKYAGEHDELLPVTEGFVDNFNGWKLTLIDSLDTMWIMGLHEEFQDSLHTVANLNFTISKDSYVPFFETVIRYLGGLLSAYALSREGLLLHKADELGAMLLPAFNTKSGLPMFAVNTATGQTKMGWNSGMLWAEGMSCQMEYKYLAHATGRTEYYEKVEAIMTLMYNTQVTDGLFPTIWSTSTGLPTTTHVSVGAFADSAYEYLLKQYLLTEKSEQRAVDLYLRSATGIINNLLYLSPRRKLLYATDIKGNGPTHVQEHLSCFLPGLLALGAHTLDLPDEQRKLHQWAAEGLANTCWMTYHDSKTGLGPDEVFFNAFATGGLDSVKWVDALKKWNGQGKPPGTGDIEREPVRTDRDYMPKNAKYILRPETVESFYFLWRTTGDEKWRERGWAVFVAIERETKTKVGYSTIMSVDDSPSVLKNEMPSFFMAETLKYLFLLFTDEEIIPLDQWVFNTEAHPLPIFNWGKWQMDAAKNVTHRPIHTRGTSV